MAFRIGNREIGKDLEPFIIAEAGINHNGDVGLAKQMIAAAGDSGADAVKFQTFRAEEFIRDETAVYTYQSQGRTVTESMMAMFRRCEFSEDAWREIKSFCDEQKIMFLSTPQNVSDLKILLDLGMEAVKIGSDDFVNLPLVRRYARENLPVLLSCGMATGEEIERTLREAGVFGGKPAALLLCTSEYPTPLEDVHISRLKTITEKYPQVIPGFSDHTQGNEAAVMAAALGARIFEKHFTLSHDLPGPDHWFSSEPQELAEWAGSVKRACVMYGRSILGPTEPEIRMRRIAHRSITAVKGIRAGEAFTEDNLAMRRPGTGLPACEWNQVMGKVSVRDIAENEQIRREDFSD